VDVVVVDEASMVDLALMAKLVDAVPPAARLIVLGDRDQLASVEAGSILGDLCGSAGDAPSAAFARRIARVTAPRAPGRPTRCRRRCRTRRATWRRTCGATPPMRDAVVRLVRSRRFRDDGAIGALARAINDGDAERALGLLGAAAATATRAASSPGSRSTVGGESQARARARTAGLPPDGAPGRGRARRSTRSARSACWPRTARDRSGWRGSMR
jgi:exodeoxyribonuclease V alpha subunit